MIRTSITALKAFGASQTATAGEEWKGKGGRVRTYLARRASRKTCNPAKQTCGVFDDGHRHEQRSHNDLGQLEGLGVELQKGLAVVGQDRVVLKLEVCVAFDQENGRVRALIL